MAVESVLDDTGILTAYTEGYLSDTMVGIECPYERGTREFDIWVVARIHRLKLLLPGAEVDMPLTS